MYIYIYKEEGEEDTHLHRPRPHVRHEHHVGVAQQARVHPGLRLEDVEPRAAHLAAVEGLDERVLVHDGAARRVDDDDAVLHLGEFGLADDVVGIFLQVRYQSARIVLYQALRV